MQSPGKSGLGAAPTGGLRPIWYDARRDAKIQLQIPAGDQLEVSDVVADQLLKSSAQFKEGHAPPAPVVGDQVDDTAPAPAKKATKKKAPAKKATSKKA